LQGVYSQATDNKAYAKQDRPKTSPFNPEALRERIAPLLDIEPEAFLQDRSPYHTDLPPSRFLRAITRPGEWMVAVPTKEAVGADVKRYYHYTSPAADKHDRGVDSLTQSGAFGAWYLNQPITGSLIDGSYRRIGNVATWRHAVLESDCSKIGLNPSDWLRFLLTVELPILSITFSGNPLNGAHALILGPETDGKDEFQAWIDANLKPLTVYGADPEALTAHRLTRLPNCWRGEKQQWQTLYYLNHEADGQHIFGAN
jgi:hypothetical protein